MADVIIRLACAGDAAAIGALWAELVAHHHALDAALPPAAADGPDRYAQALRSHLISPTVRVLVAECDGQIVGYALGAVADMISSLFAHAAAGFIADLYVCPAQQRQGIGRQLVTALADWFAGQGLTEVEWQVAAANQPALAFWRALGGAPLLLRMRAVWPKE